MNILIPVPNAMIFASGFFISLRFEKSHGSRIKPRNRSEILRSVFEVFLTATGGWVIPVASINDGFSPKKKTRSSAKF